MILIPKVGHAIAAGLVGLAGLLAPVLAQSADLTIVIVRHGEKPDEGDNLSCQGQNRALALPAVLMSKFGKPTYTYVPSLSLGKSTKHARMFQTITPLAVQQNLQLDSRFAEDDAQGIAEEVLKRSGLVLLVWEHSQIERVATAIGVNNPPKWRGEDFDSIWIITVRSGSVTLTVASEGLSPSPDCPR
jgi:hypothetical protein